MSRSLAAVWTLGALGAGAGACESTATPDAATSAWTMGPMLPRPALEPGVTALGLRVFVAGGFDTGPGAGLDITAEVDVLDTAAGTWSKLPDAPVRWVDPGLAAVGDTLYLAGGLDGQRAAHGEAFALDPLTGAWRAIPAMPPGGERGAAGVISAPDRIYLLGGVSSAGVLASGLVYDVATESWSAMPPLPAPRAHLAAMRRSDGWLIAAGGFASVDASDPRSDVWGLRPLGTAWQTLAAMHVVGEPETPAGCAYGVVLGQLTCAGGASGVSGLRVVESYDPYSDVWTLGEPMPVDRAGTPGAAAAGQLLVPGGADAATGDPTRDLYIYEPLATARRRDALRRDTPR